MFSAMTVEEKGFLENLKNSEAALRGEMEQMKNLVLQAGLDVAGGTTGFGKGGAKGKGDEGSQSKFKSWLFDLITALGSVDQGLTKSRPKIVMDGNDWDVPVSSALDTSIGQRPSNHTK